MAISIVSCNFFKKSEEANILSGNMTILVDQTVYPLVEDHAMVFESQYNAKIKLVAKSEMEIAKLLSEGKYDVAVLARELASNESAHFSNAKIKGKVTDFALDGLALIASKNGSIEQVAVQDVLAFLQGKSSSVKSLVFDNANSSTVNYLKKMAKVSDLPKKNVFSFSTNNEVIKFVVDNPGTIGVVGVNWLTQPMPEYQKVVDQVKVLGVKTAKGEVALPNQDFIATGAYPFVRTVKLLNYQGTTGLGMGFASFIAGEIGQRIVLKSGLMPVRMPGRNIILRKKI
ncbi:PstS family phosphate ABC transporter substrate-binding protein [Flavobacterium sp.]|uniref:PstS family phosphate ABC transporter substrate-binding protein n=1 Tax=Flavobacterium sp. TaxID=239 RepID=UPI003D09F6E0